MTFKEFINSEAAYNQGAFGEIGGFRWVGPNSDEYTKKGINSIYQQTNRIKPRFSGIKTRAKPLENRTKD